MDPVKHLRSDFLRRKQLTFFAKGCIIFGDRVLNTPLKHWKISKLCRWKISKLCRFGIISAHSGLRASRLMLPFVARVNFLWFLISFIRDNFIMMVFTWIHKLLKLFSALEGSLQIPCTIVFTSGQLTYSAVLANINIVEFSNISRITLDGCT